MDVHVPQGITDALRARKVSVITAQEDRHAEADDDILLARATSLDCTDVASGGSKLFTNLARDNRPDGPGG